MRKLGEIGLDQIRTAETPTSTAKPANDSEPECEVCGGVRYVLPPRNEVVRDGEARLAYPCPKCNPMPAAIGLEDERLKTATFASFDLKRNPGMQKAFEQAARVAAGDTWCCLLSGPPGLGKSHLAAAALEASTHRRPGRWWNFGGLLRHIRRQCFDEKGPRLSEDFVVDSIASTTSLVVFDDVGAEKLTEWSNQTLYAVLNTRYEMKLPTIVTTNNPDVIDDRVLSRYYEGTVVCEGKDIRRQR